MKEYGILDNYKIIDIVDGVSVMDVYRKYKKLKDDIDIAVDRPFEEFINGFKYKCFYAYKSNNMLANGAYILELN